jgi:hypothetical protein
MISSPWGGREGRRLSQALDDTINEIRDYAFGSGAEGHGREPGPPSHAT